MRLAGKVAIVTGAARGFGEGIARRFAAEGARLVLADLEAGAVQRLAAEFGAQAVPLAADVSRKNDVAAMVDEAVSRFGGLDIVVNNAGTTHRNLPMLEVDE
ncbi:MAG: SDR family NAD(P)-dependent oxidoreductase, partial [Acetobacteraceae bacterium]